MLDTLLALEVIAPCSFINANARTHWAVKRKQTAAWRQQARAAAYEATRKGTPTLPTPVRVIVWIHRPHRGRWDPGNYAPTAKALVDGLVDAGLLVDDDVTRVIGPDCRPGRPDRLETAWGRHPGVRITLHTPAEEDTP